MEKLNFLNKLNCLKIKTLIDAKFYADFESFLKIKKILQFKAYTFKKLKSA